jgi:signal transduction histidine kinase
MKERTTILRNAAVINALLQIFFNSQHRIDVCGNSKFPEKILSYSIVNKVRLEACKREDIQQRYIFEITKENINYCKDLMKVSQLCHLDENEANFVVNDIECLGFVTMQRGSLQATYSSVKEIVEQEHSVFEMLWNKAIPAEDKIREIEEGLKSEFLEVISNSKKATDIYIELAKSVKKEALILFAHSKAIIRADRLGILDYLIDACKNKGALVKIITPLTEENSQIVQQICDRAPSIKILNGGSSHSGLFIADNTTFIRFDLKDPKAEQFSEAIGFVEHSNSRVGVYSARSFFELLWNEHIQYEKLKEADNMKNQFINVAAHELRTPIQPILSLSQVLQSKINDSKQRELLDAVVRNAKRLQRLTEVILDITKIESNTLNLKIEHFNLIDVIENAIQDIRNQYKMINNNNEKLKLLYEPDIQNIFIKADKERIAQVISNLLSNAIKFTEEGSVTVNVKVNENTNNNDTNNSYAAIVSIKDTGEGVDPDFFPRLFTKFATKSLEGTGLGLFISKSIIEAHGGRIWAENNKGGNEKGATFTFTLPISKQQQQPLQPLPPE